MLTVTSLNAAIPSPLHLPNQSTAHRKPVRARAICCLRKNGDTNGLYNKASPHVESEGHDSAEMPRSSKVELEVKQNEIWGLFREAQQNILYLNKQRLMAVEALNKANREKQLLLDRIEQLEAEKQAGVGKDKLSLCWELLLRIDSMLLTGMISTGEASDLRRLIMDHKVIVADVFNEILLKKRC